MSEFSDIYSFTNVHWDFCFLSRLSNRDQSFPPTWEKIKKNIYTYKNSDVETLNIKNSGQLFLKKGKQMMWALWLPQLIAQRFPGSSRGSWNTSGFQDSPWVEESEPGAKEAKATRVHREEFHRDWDLQTELPRSANGT